MLSEYPCFVTLSQAEGGWYAVGGCGSGGTQTNMTVFINVVQALHASSPSAGSPACLGLGVGLKQEENREISNSLETIEHIATQAGRCRDRSVNQGWDHRSCHDWK